jgi:hypothetical protein
MLYHTNILPRVCQKFNKFTKDYDSWCKCIDITLYSQPNIKLKNAIKKGKFEHVICYSKIESLFDYFVLTKKLTLYNFSFKAACISSEYVSKLQNLVELNIYFCNYLIDDCIDELLKIKTLEKIELGHCSGITNEGFCKMASMSLKKLSICDCNNDLSYLENMNVSKLESIDISGCEISINDEKYINIFIKRLQILGIYKNINHVHVSSIYNSNMLSKLSCFKFKRINFYDVHDKNFYNFIAESNFENLEELSFVNTDIKNEHLVQLLNKSSQLKYLQLHFNEKDKIHTDELVEGFSKLINLTNLSISSCVVTNKLIEKLQNIKLYTLLIRSSHIVDCSNIKNLKSLRRLEISYITDDFLFYIKDLKLYDLSLHKSYINGSGLIHLTNMPINHLDLKATKIINENLIYIKDHVLDELSLSRCNNLTSSCLSLLKTMRIDCLRMYNCINIKKDDFKVLENCQIII